MITSVEGIFRNGIIELNEVPDDVSEEMRVIVTFVKSGSIDLREHGVGERLAAETRAKLASFAEDWDSSEMSNYDDYDAAKARL